MERIRKQDLIKAAKQAGVALTDNGYKLEIFCPVGKTLKAVTGIHHNSYYTKGWLREQLYREIIQDLAEGIEDCPEQQKTGCCDVCDEGIFIPEDVAEEKLLFKPIQS